ncbi:MAG: tetratricopeptide repeat protein [Kouleothrix sp.]
MANHARAAATLAALHAKPGLESDLRPQVLNALGNDAWSCSRYGEAIEWYQQTLAQAQASGDNFYQAVALANIGMIYSEIADYQQAFSYAERSYAQFHSLGRQRHAPRALRPWALCAAARALAGGLRTLHRRDYAARAAGRCRPELPILELWPAAPHARQRGPERRRIPAGRARDRARACRSYCCWR